MRVTKELKSKIERIYSDKRNELWAEKRAKEEANIKALHAQVVEEIETMSIQCPAFMFALRTVVLNNNSRCAATPADVTTDSIIKFFVDRSMGDPDGSLAVARKAKETELYRQEEDLLIQIAYAEDMGELRGLFEKFGLAW